MEVYEGFRDERGKAVVKVDGRPLGDPAGLATIAGCGRARPGERERLALAILMEQTGDECVALSYYEDYAKEVVARLPADWVLFGDEVDRWVARKRGTAEEPVAAGPADPGAPGKVFHMRIKNLFDRGVHILELVDDGDPATIAYRTMTNTTVTDDAKTGRMGRADLDALVRKGFAVPVDL